MKNPIFKLRTTLLIIVLLFLSTVFKAQEKSRPKLKIHYYGSLSYTYFNDFNISKKFKDSGLPYLNNHFSGVNGGYDLVYGKFILSLDLGMFSNSKKFQNNKRSFVRGFNSSYILSYKIFDFSNDMVYLGLGYNYSSYNAYFYLDNNIVDISNISPNNFQGILELYNSSHSIKPSIMMKLKNKSDDYFGNMRIAYNYTLSKSNWKSSNSEILNTVSEPFNHFEISYLFYIKRK